MHNRPTISVLMSVFNTEISLVKRAIDSVLHQDFQNFELIVIDDGSEHNEADQILHYARDHQDRITYVRHKNRGQSESINRGILLSSGEYIAIIDADDAYKPNHLQACLDAIKEADLIASITHTIVDYEREYYVPDKEDNSQLIHVDDCILFATLFGRKEVFESVKFQNRYAADAHFYALVSQKYRVKKVDLKTYLYYRNNPNSTCSNLMRAYAVGG
jgi:glycosyltransferase involved in cell wall biosynthesis